ncbi:MAG: hypothetical protein M1831_001169 [Alyxoria varia]|nr:MAG: hypothetical protein M1831_001169 [Alyxoria varia]
MPPLTPNQLLQIRHNFPAFPVDTTNDADDEFTRLAQFQTWAKDTKRFHSNYEHLFGRNYVDRAAQAQMQRQMQTTGPLTAKQLKTFRNNFPAFPVNPNNDAELEFTRLAQFKNWSKGTEKFENNYFGLFGRKYVDTAAQTQSHMQTAEPLTPKQLKILRLNFPTFPVNPNNDAVHEFIRLAHFRGWQEGSSKLSGNYEALFGKKWEDLSRQRRDELLGMIGNLRLVGRHESHDGRGREDSQNSSSTSHPVGEMTPLTKGQLKNIRNSFPSFPVDAANDAYAEFARLAQFKGWRQGTQQFSGQCENFFGKNWKKLAKEQKEELNKKIAALDANGGNGDNLIDAVANTGTSEGIESGNGEDLVDAMFDLGMSEGSESGSGDNLIDALANLDMSDGSESGSDTRITSSTTSSGSGIRLHHHQSSPYFSCDPTFTPQPCAPFRQEFGRFAQHKGWCKTSPKYKHEFGVAMCAEFDFLATSGVGHVTPLMVLQQLCRDLLGDGKGKGKSVPGSLTGCREALKPIHVNIFTYLDCKRAGHSINPTFKTARELSKFAKKEGICNRDVAKMNVGSKALLKVL